MEDNEIITALECCSMQSYPACRECPYHNNYGNRNCITKRNDDIKDLIKRQKSENERLQGEIESLNKKYPCTVDVGNNCLVYARSLDDYDNLIGDISAETMKEFDERYEKIKTDRLICSYCHFKDGVDNLVKEMVSDKK